MKSGVLFLLGGTLTLAGCSSQAASGHSPTGAPAPVRSATPQPPPAPVDPSPTVATATLRPAAKTVSAANAYERGKADLRAHNYEAAKTEFGLAITTGQHTADSYAGLGTAALNLGDLSTAYHAFRAAAALQPRNPGVMYYASYTALRARDFNAAVAYASRYIQLEPKDAEGYHLRMTAYAHLLKQKPQLNDARQVVALRPRNAGAYNDLGIALGNNSRYGPSIQAFTRAIQLQPSNQAYYTNRAIVENLNKQPKLALRDLYSARSLTHDALTRKQLDEAIANLQKHMQQ